MPGFVPPAPEDLAKHFSQLEIFELLGHGGMGAVYKARQKDLDRLVALKILPAEIGADPAFSERFSREARALARLSHQNIVPIYDFGKTDGLFYFVMEYVEGSNLRHLIRSGELKPEHALLVVPQLCEALQFAHDEGVVHRDIKPENILVDKRGRVRIADFGLAKLADRSPQEFSLTGTQDVMGTFHYMAPESFRGSRAVDHRADIYSLGVVFYEMLTGELPVGRFEPPSRKVQVDIRLDDVVLRALESQPEKRYQQASDLKTDVDSVSETPPVAPPPPPPPPPLAPPIVTAGERSFSPAARNIWRSFVSKPRTAASAAGRTSASAGTSVSAAGPAIVRRSFASWVRVVLIACVAAVMLYLIGSRLMRDPADLPTRGQTAGLPAAVISPPAPAAPLSTPRDESERGRERSISHRADVSADREVAEWALGLGGHVLNGGNNRWYTPEKAAEIEQTYLRLIGINFHGNKQLADRDLAKLSQFEEFEHLNLDQTNITDAGLSHITGLTKMKGFAVTGTRVTDAGLEAVKDFTKLTWLMLGASQITDRSMEHVGRMMQLENLFLAGTQVTDEGLRDLTGLKKLKVLNLPPATTDAGLRHLYGMKSLERLDLRGTRTTGSGVGALKSTLPNCRMIR